MSLNPQLEKKLRLAIRQFWKTRQSQALKQGTTSGKRDAGQRSARMYDSACFLLSNSKGGAKGEYREQSEELNFQKFISSLLAHAIANAKTRKSQREN